ncbi:flavin-containing monooxygenase [Deinococcus koreensis]|uniref:FAD-dependent oxidoreductase n=1 Tax=Deinococcus koreensis TaxID=2054903 RepID=A0A2K3USI9_9DEIO|nr:NAD(P)/FAD-dependent oxidoreductase [Deinococcus koreensis]PNY79480.1 FAD-dependent oxidoreductase [Deinococcus koreensis]
MTTQVPTPATDIPPQTPSHEVRNWLMAFGGALERQDIAAVTGLFEPGGFWRDLLSFTWNIKTLEGREPIADMLRAQLAGALPSNWELEGEATEAGGVTEAWLTFDTAVSRGRGHLRLRDGQAWTLLTTMLELKGHEERTGSRRERGAEHGAVADRKNWLDRKMQEEAELGHSRQPYTVIIGGGQGGIALGARLRRLGVPTLIIEKHERPGDSWRKRYHSLCLHDPVWYDHLPYLPFPEDWPVFSPKDKIADWLEMYTRIMELNYWGGTEAKSARWDDQKQEWEVRVVRGGQEVVLRPKQLVMATGMSGIPNTPSFPGMDSFQGTQVHSSAFRGGEEWRGRKAVVVGSNNSAHDICADLWEHGADVTMLQRSSTHIARSESLMELALGGLYSEEALKSGIGTDMADLIFASIPYRVLPSMHVPVYEEMARRDADLYDRLKKAGFLLDFGDDGSGLFMKYLRRGSGYYIDVGASELVADGKVKLRSGVSVQQVNARSLTLSDGSELPADLIVYATGYGSMNGWAAKLISQETADRVGKVWGLGSGTTKDPGPWEGELRNMWKPTQVPNLWFHGGNLHQSRHYSLYLSLQLKARMEGIPTPVYGLQEVHHLS